MRPLFSAASEFDDAFVLSRVLYGDSDCIVRLLCKKNGRIDAFVRAGMRSTKTRPGTISAPSLIKITFVRGRNNALARISHFDTCASTFSWSSSLESLANVSYIAEIIDKFIAHSEESVSFYVILANTLGKMSVKQHNTQLLRAFELKLLAFCGYLPELSFVVDSPGSHSMAYDSNSCHLLAQKREGCLVFSEGARVAAKQLVENPIGLKVEFSAEVLLEVGQIFASRLKFITNKPLKSIEFLKGLKKEIGSS